MYYRVFFWLFRQKEERDVQGSWPKWDKLYHCISCWVSTQFVVLDITHVLRQVEEWVIGCFWDRLNSWPPMIIMLLVHAEGALNVMLVSLLYKHWFLLVWMSVPELLLIVGTVRIRGAHFTKFIITVILLISKMSSDKSNFHKTLYWSPFKEGWLLRGLTITTKSSR